MNVQLEFPDGHYEALELECVPTVGESVQWQEPRGDHRGFVTANYRVAERSWRFSPLDRTTAAVTIVLTAD